MRLFQYSLLLLLLPFAAAAQGLTDQNRELPRSGIITHRDKDKALKANKAQSENYIELTGDWTKAPRKEGANLVFERTFSIPFDYLDKSMFITVEGAAPSVKLFVNGNQVGYSSDSHTRAEFDITQYAVRGINKLALQIDTQDPVKLIERDTNFGLDGEIYLFAQPKIRIRDFIVETTMEQGGKNGLLQTALLLKTQLLNTHKVTVFYELYNPQGEMVNQAERELSTKMRGEDTVRFTASVANVQKWSAENPKLYTLIYSVKREGRITEIFATKIGFRTVEILNGKFLVNGNVQKIRGANVRQLSDLQQVKELGFNAVRTPYPISSRFYEVCDSLGLYVCDVANISGQKANNPEWSEDFVFRTNNMYEQSKNHPAVVMWSMGDNAGNGYNMYEAYMALRAKDKYRPVAYNGASMEFNTDIYAVDFVPVVDTKKLDGQPVIFSHAKFDKSLWQRSETQGAFVDNWTTNSFPKGVEVRKIDGKTLEFTNNLEHSNFADIDIYFTTFRKDKEVEQGKIEVRAAAGESVKVAIPTKKAFDEIEIQVGTILKKRL